MIRESMVGLIAFSLLALMSMSCGEDQVTTAEIDEIEALIQEFELSPLPSSPPYPPDNPYDPDRIRLGRLLFFDPILGGESAPWVKRAAGKDPYRFRGNDMACATCHLPEFAFGDGRRLGAGVGGSRHDGMAMGPDRIVPAPSLITGDPVGDEPRHTLTILNAAFNGRETHIPTADSFQLWDGFADHGLESQAVLPIVVPDEMAGDAYGQPAPWVAERVIQDSVAARIRDIPEYVRMFQDAFPSEITVEADLDIGHIARAISAFERELITPGSRYDRFVAGERGAFNARETQGFRLFFGKALCGGCHFGPMLSDFTYRVQGVADQYDVMMPGFEGKNFNGGDWGRFHADDALYTDMKLAFRVPTIRNVEFTAPYFHTGSAATLRDVVEFYNHPTREPMAFPDSYFEEHGVTRDPSIVDLGLSESEIEAIIEFMKTTTAAIQTTGPLGTTINEIPGRVPSGLLPPGIPTPEGPGPYYPDP